MPALDLFVYTVRKKYILKDMVLDENFLSLDDTANLRGCKYEQR